MTSNVGGLEVRANALAELFPDLPHDLLLDVLLQHENDDEAAIASLLALSADSSSPLAQCGPGRPAAAAAAAAAGGAAARATRAGAGTGRGRARPRSGGKQAQPPRRVASWGSMGLAADLQGKLQLAPEYTEAAPGGSHPSPAHPSSLAARTAGRWPQPSEATWPVSAAAAAKRSPRAPPLPAAPAGWPPARPPLEIHSPAVAPSWPAAPPAGAGEAAPWQRDAEEQLRLLHPWAGGELVGLLLAAVEFDLSTAEAILADMAAPPAGGEAPAVGAGSDLGDSSCESEGEGKFGDVYADDWVLPSGVGAPNPQAAAAAAAARRPRPRPQPSAPEPAPSDLRLPPQPGASGCVSSTSTASASSTDDVYWRHRREAQRLTREWQRAVSKAAAAYSSGSHSRARRLAAEAQRLRRESLAAHEAAAGRIEAEVNASGSLLELDLHGLHAAEAVAALDRRLALLRDLLRDAAATQPQGGAGAATPALVPLPGRGQWELRVIVGRGAHSSGGEASIPRVVEARLQALGLAFHRRTGALDVVLPRCYARGPAAPATAAVAPAPGRGVLLQ